MISPLSFTRALLASITYFHLPWPEHRAGLWKMILIFITALVTYMSWWTKFCDLMILRKTAKIGIDRHQRIQMKARHCRSTLSIDIIYVYLTLFFVWHTKVALTTEKYQLDFKIWYLSNIKLCISWGKILSYLWLKKTCVSTNLPTLIFSAFPKVFIAIFGQALLISDPYPI